MSCGAGSNAKPRCGGSDVKPRCGCGGAGELQGGQRHSAEVGSNMQLGAGELRGQRHIAEAQLRAAGRAAACRRGTSVSYGADSQV